MFVILASPLTIEPERREWKTGMHVGARAAGILVNQIYREDLDYALMVNEAVSGYGRLRSALIAALGQVSADALLARVPYRFRPPDYREVRLWTVVPSVSFSEPLQFEPQRIRAADAGREARPGTGWTRNGISSCRRRRIRPHARRAWPERRDGSAGRGGNRFEPRRTRPQAVEGDALPDAERHAQPPGPPQHFLVEAHGALGLGLPRYAPMCELITRG